MLLFVIQGTILPSSTKISLIQLILLESFRTHQNHSKRYCPVINSFHRERTYRFTKLLTFTPSFNERSCLLSQGQRYGVTSMSNTVRTHGAGSLLLTSSQSDSEKTTTPKDGTISESSSWRATNPSGTRFKCSQCDFQTAYRFVVERHQRKHTGDFFRCHLCTCKFFDKYQLSYHLKGHRGELQCRYCSKLFSSTTCLYYHERKHKLGQI